MAKKKKPTKKTAKKKVAKGASKISSKKKARTTTSKTAGIDLSALFGAAVKVAVAKCKQNPGGCDGPWCEAQQAIRDALDDLGIKWEPVPEPKIWTAEDQARADATPPEDLSFLGADDDKPVTISDTIDHTAIATDNRLPPAV